VRRIGLVTCRVLPERDPDQELLLDALRASGAEPELVAWDDPDADPADAFDCCILRSCWNYHLFPEQFQAWVDSASRTTRLWNPGHIVTWNLNKRYLESLAASGVRTVPTEWLAKGQVASVRNTVRRTGWQDIVVKPAVSASSYRTYRFRLADGDFVAAQSVLDSLVRERDVMIQPYVPGVETWGERAVMWIDGEITHAVRKTPRFTGQGEVVSGMVAATDAEREMAMRSVAAATKLTGVRPMYARIDLMPDAREGPLVSELELIEPSLYLTYSPAALDRFVGAIAATGPAS